MSMSSDVDTVDDVQQQPSATTSGCASTWSLSSPTPYLYPVKGTPIKLWKSPDIGFVNHVTYTSLFAGDLLHVHACLYSYRRVRPQLLYTLLFVAFIRCRKAVETFESDSEESCIVIEDNCDSDDSCVLMEVEPGKLLFGWM